MRVKGKTGAKIDLFYLPQVKLLFRDVQRYFNRKRDAYGKASGYAHVASRAVDALRNTTKLDYDSRPATRQRRAALGISPLGVQVQVPDDD